jgi:Cu2+-exporting ATPase
VIGAVRTDHDATRTAAPTDRGRDADADADADASDGGCRLCSLPTPEPPVRDADGEVAGAFCCRGCLAVQRALGDADPAERESLRAALDADGAGGTDGAEGGDDAVPDDAGRRFLAVDGMHCATCETFVEATADGVDGVYAAEASYASELLRVTAAADADLDRLGSRLARYGYRTRDPDVAGETEERADSQLVRFLLGGGVFGMMVMLWYVLFLYPAYLGFTPLVDLGGLDGLYLFAQVWLLSSLVLFYTGFPILRGAVVSLRAGQPNVDLLVAVAACAAYAYSTVAMLAGRTHLYFDVTVAIVLVVTLGNYYEKRVRRAAADRLSALTAARVREAVRLGDEGGRETVPTGALEPGDRVLVRPGERVPVDGVVAEGTAAVDESLVTGEAVPRTRRAGDEVLGGTVVTDAPLVVGVDDDGASTLDRVVDLTWELQSTRSGAQRLADRLAVVFVPLVLVLAVLAAAWALLSGATPTDALLSGLTVLVVSCPCALGLATPLAVAAGVRDAAARGVVVASPAVFEAAPDADVVVFDKTGTLTDGAMTVRRAVRVDGDGPDADANANADADADASAKEDADLLARAAALEVASAHPVAEAVVDAARAAGVGPSGAPADAAVEVRDRGVVGRVDGAATVVGHPALVRAEGVDVPPAAEAAVADARATGAVPVVVAVGGAVRGVLVVDDAPRDGWDRVLDAVGADRDVVVLTGDDERAAAGFREHPAVDEVFAGVPPDAKAETVRRLRARGTVAMVGDGSNDAPALAAADVGVALAEGTDLAGDAADAVVVRGGLDAVPRVFAVGRGTNRRVRTNLAWAFLYNAVAVPLAVAGLLNPLFAAVAMGTSSLLVVANSARSTVRGEAAADPAADGTGRPGRDADAFDGGPSAGAD